MAVPNTPNPAAGSRVIAPAPEPSTVANSGLILDAHHRAHKFALYVLRDRLECHMGEFVAPLLVATTEPGINGNGKDNSGTGARMACQSLGAVQVPDNFPLVSFGEPSTGHPVSYLRRWEQTAEQGGSKVLVAVHYSDAWHRPRILGTSTRWDQDLNGYNTFLRDVTLWAHGGTLDEVLVAEAAEHLISEIRQQAIRGGAMSDLRLRVMLGHLPDAYTPADLNPLRARLIPSDATPAADKPARKAKPDSQPTA
jgi:hypothetical protein